MIGYQSVISRALDGGRIKRLGVSVMVKAPGLSSGGPMTCRKSNSSPRSPRRRVKQNRKSQAKYTFSSASCNSARSVCPISLQGPE